MPRGRIPAIPRSFDEKEIELFEKAQQRYTPFSNGLNESTYAEHFKELRKATRVTYQPAGNFMKCVIFSPNRIFVGVAKRNPTEPVNFETARNIAFFRAVTEPSVQV